MTRTLAVLTLAALLGVPSIAVADLNQNFNVTTAGGQGQPLALSACAFTGYHEVSATVVNVTAYDLKSFEIRLSFYDASNTLRVQHEQKWSLDEPVVPQDSISKSSGMYLPDVGNEHSFDHVVCRVQSATFAGNKRWTYGHPWKYGKLASPQASPSASPLKHGVR